MFRTMTFQPEPEKNETVKNTNRQEDAITHCDGMDISKLHRGKKKIAKNANALLEDKSELISFKEQFAALSIVTDDIYVPANDIEYDDVSILTVFSTWGRSRSLLK